MDVLKFGSSILKNDGDYAAAVHEVYRRVRQGRRVIAVVSAAHGVTDNLLDQAEHSWGRPAPEPLAAWIATGELVSAAQMRLALDRAGVPATVLSPWQCRLTCDGPADAAIPAELDRAALEQALTTVPVVVVPGFAGIQRGSNTLCTLGRGGSDLSAVFLAAELDAPCVLYKDTDGIYDRDPAQDSSARRFSTVDWKTTARLAGKAVQPAALALAAQRNVALSVQGIAGGAGTSGTRIGDVAAAPAGEAAPPLRIGLIGLGTVGQGVYEHLQRLPHAFHVEQVLTRTPRVGVRGNTTDVAAFTAGHWDVCVDTSSDPEFALGLALTVLARGRDFVTASKVLAGEHAEALERVGQASAIRYSAAVGGGTPALEAVRKAVDSRADVRSIEATVSGTANYVLNLLDRHPLEVAVERAREAGLCEADPSEDLGGLDAARKLSILVRELWGKRLDVDQIPRDAIDATVPDRIAQSGARTRIRQVARARRVGDSVHAEVRLLTLPIGSPLLADSSLDRLHGDENVLVLNAPDRTWVTRGRGAGRWPTAESIVADLIDLRHPWRSTKPTQGESRLVGVGS